jgi:NADH:ubiquinone reductase (H+-translocating)
MSISRSTRSARTMHAATIGPQGRHHVVVIGSGFGGFAATQGRARADVEVTLVANTPHHGVGVAVVLGAAVSQIDERSLRVRHRDGRFAHIAGATKVWASGVSASPLGRTLAKQTGAELDRSSRARVRADLTVPGHPEVLVVGDMAIRDLPGGPRRRPKAGATPRPRSASDCGADHGADRSSTTTRAPWPRSADSGPSPRSAGSSSVGRWGARTGLTVHLAFLVGFRNRLTAVPHWTASFLGRPLSQRTATEQQVFGRGALTLLPGGRETPST